MTSDFEVTNEIRFAVVMYGGISLAIYMNGIAQELLHLVRSTARKGWEDEDERQFRFTDEELNGTEAVYRRLAQHLTHAPKADGVRKNGVRFIVDILSGTSAGGINGIFLAKALANGQSIDSLEDLWVREGDLGKLLNDAESAKGVNLPEPSHQKSLLNSDRMYCKLLEAFTGMDPTSNVVGTPAQLQTQTEPPLSFVEELDLYVTTTDIRGRVIPLRTSDRLVYERNYKWAFHFKYIRPELCLRIPGEAHKDDNNHFEYQDNPFLAFAARCTSSFPFAFEPMCFNKVEELVPSYPGYKVDIDRWKQFFAKAHTEGPECEELKSRSFGDGAYLDNKPFGYAIDMLKRRSGDIPSQRKLIYIEPAPEHPELRNSEQRKKDLTAPNALDNSLAALVTLPGYQPIRDDLLRINERNRTIRKVTELIDGVSRQLWSPDPFMDSSKDPSKPDSTRVPLPSLQLDPKKTLAEVLSRRGPAYVSYALLRVYDTTDSLANLIGKALNYERESSYFFAIRCIVRAWREMFYERAEPNLESRLTIPEGVTPIEGQTLTAFLADFDLAFSVRCTKFVTGQIDNLYVLDDRAERQLKALGLVGPQGKDKDDKDKDKDKALGSVVPQDKDRESFREGLRILKKPFDDRFRALRATTRSLDSDPSLKKALADLDRSLLDRVLGVAKPTDPQRGPFAPFLEQDDNDRYAQNARDLLTRDPEAQKTVSKLNEIAVILRAKVNRVVHDTDLKDDLQKPLPDKFELAHKAVKRLYEQFPEYDAALFPVLYGTDVGELDLVDVIRISPEDATTIVDELRDSVRKLKGTWLGHFGAFLDARWRRNDILWGRLDTAERLIRSLLPQGETADALVKQAHNSILRDLVKGSQVDVAEQLANAALARASGQPQ